MISDVLFDSSREIQEYLKVFSDTCYNNRLLRKKIKKVVRQMDKLQKWLDVVPISDPSFSNGIFRCEYITELTDIPQEEYMKIMQKYQNLTDLAPSMEERVKIQRQLMDDIAK